LVQNTTTVIWSTHRLCYQTKTLSLTAVIIGRNRLIVVSRYQWFKMTIMYFSLKH